MRMLQPDKCFPKQRLLVKGHFPYLQHNTLRFLIKINWMDFPEKHSFTWLNVDDLGIVKVSADTLVQKQGFFFKH